jgi:hypothetical protein
VTARGRGILVGLLAAAALHGAAASAAAGTAAVPAPFRGSALWTATISPQQSGASLAAAARAVGAGALYVKAADGTQAQAGFSAPLLAEIRSAGETACAWTFAYGRDPLGEAAAAIAAVRAGAQCLVVDAEAPYDGLYGAAQQFVRALRAALGARFPIGLAGEAEVAVHPRFPYSVFLGPGGFSVDQPQIYWRDFGVAVAAAYAATIPVNSIYGRPIVPVGQLFGAPLASEVATFRALARAYGLPGESFFDLDSALAEQLAGLTERAAPLPSRAAQAPTLRAGADGDEVVWAQELLNADRARLPVGGFFGAQTERAVAGFQRRHRLPVTGTIGTATWRALLRLRAREPSWAAAPPDSAR